MVELVRKILHLIYLYLPKIQTNSTTMLSTFSWVKTICNTSPYEHLNSKYAIRAFVQNATHLKVQAPKQKKDTTIELLVKSYTGYIYNTCHLVKWCQNSGKHLKSV